MGFETVSATPIAALRVYLERLPGLQAELKIMLAAAASLPHTSDSAREHLLAGWEEQMLGDLPHVPRVAPPALLALMGIRVVDQPAPKPDLLTNDKDKLNA